MEIEDLKNNPEAVKKLIDLLSSLIETPQDEEANTQPSKKNTKKNNAKVTNVRGRNSRSERPKHTNKFLTMSEKNMFKEDVQIDKLLSKYPPTERSRSTAKIDVKCRICGREETIHPSMLCESVERYKCNNCSTSPG